MKLLTRGLFVLFSMLFLSDTRCGQGPKSANPQIINPTDADSGKVLNISKGTAFTLTLPDHVDGGYRFDKAQFDTVVLRLDNYTEKPPPASSPPGRPGLAFWQFTAIETGKSTLKITATRPWKGGGTLTIFENTVIVK